MNKTLITVPNSIKWTVNRLEAAGFEAWAVGGCVRDSFLGRTPNDWDVTTSALPSDVTAVFSDCRTVETGIQHGTVTLILEGELIEITTYRTDGAYEDNRHPTSVSFASRVEDDLSRRDFTVNAMAYHEKRGLVDLFGGQNDLKNRIIACVGDPETRFCEDGLRILRAIRFASVLDFTLEPETAKAVHKCRSLLSGIAAERIREEFCKLIRGVGAVRILREYIDVISVFLPELGACVGFEQNTKYHCWDVFEHTLHALEITESDDLITRLAILLHDVGKPLCYTEDESGGHFKGHGPVGTELTANILKRLRFDNATADAVTLLVKLHDCAYPAEVRTVKRLMQKTSDENILRLMEVQRCDRLAHAPLYREHASAIFEIPVLLRQIREANECFSLSGLAVDGNDLIALGIERGKRIGIILQELLNAVIDGKLQNKKEALLDFVRAHFLD